MISTSDTQHTKVKSDASQPQGLRGVFIFIGYNTSSRTEGLRGCLLIIIDFEMKNRYIFTFKLKEYWQHGDYGDEFEATVFFPSSYLQQHWKYTGSLLVHRYRRAIKVIVSVTDIEKQNIN